MPELLTRQHLRWTESLAQAADSVHLVGHGVYELHLAHDEPLAATARITDDWLSVETHLESSVDRADFLAAMPGLLLQNGRLRGGVRFGLNSRPERLVLGVDIPLDEEAANISQWIALACAELLQAARNAAQGLTLDAISLSDDRIEPAQGPADDDRVCAVRRLLEEVDWPFTERVGGRFSVPLDVDGGRIHAAVEPAESAPLRLATPLPQVAEASAAGQLAVALFLLTACRVVRMARAVSTGSGESPTYCWEIWLSDAPTARQLGQALSSLSIACRLTARELPVLADDVAARCYLAARGWSECLPSVNRSVQKGA